MQRFRPEKQKRIQGYSAGFSLIELLVTIGIFAFISSFILANYPRFSQRLLFTRTAQEVAQTIRRAETYSIGVRGLERFEHPYGVYFSLSSPQSYIFFADRNPENKVYDPNSEPGQDEKINEFSLPSSVRISDMCVETSCGLPELHVTYKRPAPTVFFSNGTDEISNPSARLILVGPDDSLKTIVIWKTGQVSIE